MTHEQQRLPATATTRTRLELGLGWPTPTDRGTGITPNGVEANFRAYGSGSARCAACTAGLGVLVAPSTHAVNADTDCIKLAYIGHWAGSAVYGHGFNEWVVPIASFSPDGAVCLLRIVSCLFSAVSLQTDNAVVMEQGDAATQHAAVM